MHNTLIRMMKEIIQRYLMIKMRKMKKLIILCLVSRKIFLMKMFLRLLLRILMKYGKLISLSLAPNYSKNSSLSLLLISKLKKHKKLVSKNLMPKWIMSKNVSLILITSVIIKLLIPHLNKYLEILMSPDKRYLENNYSLKYSPIY